MSSDSDHHPAALRNRQPILDELLKLVDPSASGAALEIASGTGAHLEHFAPNFPRLQWQPSEYVEARVQTIGGVERAVDERLLMIDAHGAKALKNVRPAVDLDVSLPFTSWPAVVQADASKHALVYCSNMCHIAHWQCTLGLLAGAAAALAPGGKLIVYGPFKLDGAFIGDDGGAGNRQFDATLRQRNPEFGYRDTREVAAAAGEVGLALSSTTRMPANNLLLEFVRG